MMQWGSSVRISVLLVVAVLLLAGCAGKKDTATVTAPTGASSEAPDAIGVTLEAQLPETTVIRSIGHDGDSPKRPGDPVTFTVDAVVPEGATLRVQVVETDWGLSTGRMAGGRYALASSVPQDLPSGRYPVRANIVDGQGNELAAALASRPLEIQASTSCAKLQTGLDALVVYFAFDKYSLDEAATANLGRIAAALRGSGRTDFEVHVEGHCDERGTIEYNLTLSEERARAARDYLVNLGAVAEGQTRLSAYGEERPVDPGHNESAWAKNRRAEFKVVCAGN